MKGIASMLTVSPISFQKSSFVKSQNKTNQNIGSSMTFGQLRGSGRTFKFNFLKPKTRKVITYGEAVRLNFQRLSTSQNPKDIEAFNLLKKLCNQSAGDYPIKQEQLTQLRKLGIVEGGVSCITINPEVKIALKPH